MSSSHALGGGGAREKRARAWCKGEPFSRERTHPIDQMSTAEVYFCSKRGERTLSAPPTGDHMTTCVQIGAIIPPPPSPGPRRCGQMLR
eukprot:3708340-Prymnesium_polylepis.3